MDKQHRLNIRALVALTMVCSFVWLPVAGIGLHFADNAAFQPTRHLLMTIHDLAAVVFLVSLLIHLKLNLKPLLNYLKISAEKGKQFRTEFGFAVLIVAAPLTIGILHVFVLGSR